MKKWLYRKSSWLYMAWSNIRITWYVYTGQRQKAIGVIHEDREWHQTIS